MMEILTPSTGARRPATINMNRFRVKPGDLVIYQRRDATFAINVIADYGAEPNNFVIDGETIFVTYIHGVVDPEAKPTIRETIIADFGKIKPLTWHRCDELRNKHWLG